MKTKTLTIATILKLYKLGLHFEIDGDRKLIKIG